MRTRKSEAPFQVFVVYLLLFAMCLWILEEHEQAAATQAEGIMVEVQRGEKRMLIPLEEYVVGVVASEMPASFSLEALKAQCVASRTFVASREFRVDDSTASQVYKSDEELRSIFKGEYEEKIAKIKEAAAATSKEIMMYDGEIISALFFSTSNGYTVNSQDYFTSDLPYLQAVSSQWDLHTNENAIRTVSFTYADLQSLLQCEDAVEISIISRYEDHRVKEVKVNTTIYSGRELRELLGLRSTDFTIKKEGTGLAFTTVGFGHGVGMSQYGAQGMAQEGYLYHEILQHYYQGVEIRKLS